MLGVSADPEKVSTIKAMKEPSDVSEVRCFLGMTNHLINFLPHLADKIRPLRVLLRKSNMWVLGPQQQQAFDSIRNEPMYDPNVETLVSAVSSSYGIGVYFSSNKLTLDGNRWRTLRELSATPNSDTSKC